MYLHFLASLLDLSRGASNTVGTKVPSLGPSLQEVSVSKAEAGAGMMNKHCNIIIVAPGYWFSKALLPEALPDLRRWVKKKY